MRKLSLLYDLRVIKKKRKKRAFRMLNNGIHIWNCEFSLVLQVKFHIQVQAGNSRKVVAVIAIKRLEPTWIILDREMKKEKRYFMEKLSCGISKLKSDNSIEEVRGPIKLMENTKVSLTRNTFSYDEMIPGEDDVSEERPSSQLNSKAVSRTRTSCKEQASSIPGKLYSDFCENKVKRSSSTDLVDPSSSSSFHNLKTKTGNSPSHEHINDNDQYLYGVIHECSFCGNRRPKMRLHKEFSYKELEEATKGFANENFLSEGGFGSVYKGYLKNGLRVAVKQHNDMSLQGDKEFKSEVEVLSKARHPNLVMLLGSCSEGSQKLLVYEYVCYGSLDKFLSGDIRMCLNWEKRLKIALGAARGLEYLHKHNIIHRDIRPNNILITHDHESLLGDFGLAKAAYDESQHSSGNNVVGTFGYMAPEYAASGKFSTKTDVYAFGVVLLQLITGLKNTDNCLEDKSLVEWAMPLLEQKNYPRLIDKSIVDSHDFHQLFWMVELAAKCLEKDPDKRNTMEWVVKILSDIMEGNADTCIDFNTKSNDEDDKIVGTVTTSSSFSTDRTCSSKRWSPSSSNSTHEECESRKIPLKHKGATPNKSKLLYKEMIH
ncbi:probable serine/threonine-protein kinase PBL6 [Solanum pennellii]|uniref:Probable serine/threonine-protein kinase PBL6 n=1 Tax=Solanum pennellii TaxID=28526 RepID=A0ABM1V2E2_SOLPN|nr:probable serine/threonine-protein kinase PBL6 [Solanum pennellii]